MGKQVKQIAIQLGTYDGITFTPTAEYTTAKLYDVWNMTSDWNIEWLKASARQRALEGRDRAGVGGFRYEARITFRTMLPDQAKAIRDLLNDIFEDPMFPRVVRIFEDGEIANGVVCNFRGGAFGIRRELTIGRQAVNMEFAGVGRALGVPEPQPPIPETVGYIGVVDAGGTLGAAKIYTDLNLSGNMTLADFQGQMVNPTSARFNNQDRLFFTGMFATRGGVQIWNTDSLELLYQNADPSYQGGEVEDGFYFVVEGDRLYRRNILTHAIDWDIALPGWTNNRVCQIHSHRDGYVWVLPIRDNGGNKWFKVSWDGVVLNEVDKDTVCASFDIYRNGDLAVLTRNPTSRDLIGLDRYEPDGETLKWRYSLSHKEPILFEINYEGVMIDEEENVFACWEDGSNSRGSQYFKLGPNGAELFMFQYLGSASGNRFQSLSIPSINNDFFYMTTRDHIRRYNRTTGAFIENINPIGATYSWKNIICDPGYLAKIK